MSDDVVQVAGRTLAEVQREVIALALRRNGGDTQKAAAELGISRDALLEWTSGASNVVSVRSDDDDWLHLPRRTLRELEREVIVRAVRRHGGKKTEVAEELKISRSYVQKRLAPDEPDP